MNLHFLYRTVLVLSGLIAAASVQAAPPGNDNFANAAILPPGGTYDFADNFEATREAEEQNAPDGSKTVWFKWTPNTTGYAGFRTSSFQGSIGDTVVAVYQGTALANLRPVVLDDDAKFGEDRFSYAVFPAVANSTYYIQVRGFGASAVLFGYQNQPPAPTSFNLFVDASSAVSGISLARTWQTLGDANRVFGVQNTGTGPMVAHLSSDIATGIFSRNRIVSEPYESTVTATLEIPTAFGLPGLASGTLTARSPSGAGTEKTLVYSPTFQNLFIPANDNFADACVIKGTNVVINGRLDNATAEPGEPNLVGSTNTVWYSYTPSYTLAGTGTVTLTSDGGTVADPVLHIYTGNSLNALTAVGDQNDGGTGSNFLYRGALTQGTKYYIRIRNNFNTSPAGVFRMRLNFADAVPALGTSQITAVSAATPGDFSSWTTFGASSNGLASVTTGSRFAVNVQPAPAGTYRVLGWVSTSAVNMTSNVFGPFSNQFAFASRARFAIYATGQSDPTKTNQIPNMRLRVAHRFAATAMLDLQHHNNADAATEVLGADLAPSRDPLRPSVYTVYLPNIGVPATNNTAEPILRAFEAFSADPQDNGSLNMTESSIEPVYFNAATGPVSDEQDARGRLMKIYDAAAGDLVPNAVSVLALNPATLQDDLSSPRPTVTSGIFGVTLDTSMVAASRIGVATADFISGTVADTADRTRRVRVEPNSLYRIRFHATSNRPSSANAQIRFRARTARFVYNNRLEVGPSNGASAANNTIASQFLPGFGCQNPDRDFFESNGGWYTLYFPTPLDPAIRPEFPGKSLTVSMPNFATQPGPGDPAISRRDLAVGIDVIDSLGAGANAALDQGQVTLDRITIEQMTVPN